MSVVLRFETLRIHEKIISVEIELFFIEILRNPLKMAERGQNWERGQDEDELF